MTNQTLLSPYSTIVFDGGGTLLRLDLDLLAHTYVRTAAALGISIDVVRARTMLDALQGELVTWQQARPVSLEKDNGQEFWNSFYTEGFRRLGVERDVFPAVTEIRECFQRAEFETLYSDVLPTLDALARGGARLGILSNFSVNLEDILKNLGIHHYFEFFVISAAVGVEKPDRKIFDVMVRAANRSRGEIVYIGDSIFHDIEGARGAGLAGILVDRQNRHRDFVGARVQDLRELIR